MSMTEHQRPLGDFSEEWVLERARQQYTDGRLGWGSSPGAPRCW